MFLTILIIYIIIKSTTTYREDVSDSTLILIVVGVISFTIASFFVAVYSDAIEAIYITYLIDKERGDAVLNCPPELKDFLDDTERNDEEYRKHKREKEERKRQKEEEKALGKEHSSSHHGSENNDEHGGRFGGLAARFGFGGGEKK